MKTVSTISKKQFIINTAADLFKEKGIELYFIYIWESILTYLILNILIVYGYGYSYSYQNYCYF